MAHTIERASSGRSRCKGCSRNIAKGELRFGERLPSLYGDGDMTLWFHINCATCRRPESLFSYLQENDAPAPPVDGEPDSGKPQVDRALLDFCQAHRRVQQIVGAEPASSGRARCRHCREPIAKDTWRIPLTFFEEGTFNPSGFVHIACVAAFFETREIVPILRHLTDLTDDVMAEIKLLI